HDKCAAPKRQETALFIKIYTRVFETSACQVAIRSAERNQPLVPVEQSVMRRLAGFLPVELRPLKGLGRLRIGHIFRIPPERGEFIFSPFGDGVSHLRIFVSGEILEWG